MQKLISRGSIRSSICLLLMLALTLFASAPVLAVSSEDTGRLTGQLVDGSNKNAPLANQEILLQMAQGTTARDLTTTKTDAQGNFTFTNLDRDKTKSYVAFIRYQGAQYTSSPVSFADTSEKNIKLTVYQATQNMDSIAVLQSTVLLRQNPNKQGLLTFSEVYVFQNLSQKTFAGSFDTAQGQSKPNALRFSLPIGAKNIALKKGFDGYKVTTTSKGFATDAALLPGINEFSFTFDVPYNSSTYDFFYQTIFPTAGLTVYVSANLDVTTDAFTAEGLINKGSTPYKSFSAKTIAPNRELNLQVNGLNVPEATAGRIAVNSNLGWLIAAILAMLVIVGLTWYFYRRQSRQSSTQAATGITPGSSKDAGKNGEDTHQALLAQMLQLDKQYESGKIQKAAYDERRGKLKARLRTVMREGETSRR